MLQSKNLKYLALPLLLIIITIWLGQQYKKAQTQTLEQQKFNHLSRSIQSQLTTLIAEKQSATNTLAITLTQDKDIAYAFKNPKNYLDYLKKLTQRLKQSTDYKNVWIQLISVQGKSLARTWSDEKGEDLSKIRVDVKQMIKNPQAKSTISVGKFDLSFKSMVPIYNDNQQFIGIIEVITHFNSIAEKLQANKLLPVFAVNQHFKSQLKMPFTNIFAGDHYVANKNASPQLIELITSKGLSHFISESQPYVMDRENKFLIIHQALFDNNNNLLADLLVFKPLNLIDLSAINEMKNNINLLMILAIFIIIFATYFLKNRNLIGSLKTADETKFKQRFLTLYILLVITYTGFITWSYQSTEANFIKSYNLEIERDYSIFYEKLETLSLVTLQNIIQRPEINRLMRDAYGSAIQKEQARTALFNLLKDEYEGLKAFDIKQLHFHLKNNESFLRFHRPEKYGDNLTGIRQTVEWVNSHNEPFQGFEEGRIFNGFRYVYPISHINITGQTEHLGSVEISFTAHAIAKEFANFRHARTGFIIKKSLVEKNVFTSELDNYIPSELTHFLAEKQVTQALISEGIATNLQNFSKEQLSQISHQINRGVVFSMQPANSHINQNILFSFIPIKNTFNEEVSAAIIIQKESPSLLFQKQLHFILLLSGLALISFLVIFIFKESLNTKRYKHLSSTTQQILDSQESIILVTNGQYPDYVNQAFLSFFDYPNLNAFLKKHTCVCELFEEDERFFHLGKLSKSQYNRWPELILKLPSNKRMVCLLDKEHNPVIFSLLIKPFDNSYIFNFVDITDTMKEHFLMESKAIHDPLTQAYNRQYFETISPNIIKSTQNEKRKLGALFLDIDHFKKINDTYGHATGDLVLKQLVDIIHNHIRSQDVLIRWGGEEFLILISVHSFEDLAVKAEKLRLTISSSRFKDVNLITSSIGIALYQENESLDDFIARADKALYQAKTQGRNRIFPKSDIVD